MPGLCFEQPHSAAPVQRLGMVWRPIRSVSPQRLQCRPASAMSSVRDDGQRRLAPRAGACASTGDAYMPTELAARGAGWNSGGRAQTGREALAPLLALGSDRRPACVPCAPAVLVAQYGSPCQLTHANRCAIGSDGQSAPDQDRHADAPMLLHAGTCWTMDIHAHTTGESGAMDMHESCWCGSGPCVWSCH